MTHEEAIKRAEETIYVYYTWGDILDSCEARGIPTRNKRGNYISRPKLETALIMAMISEMEGMAK
ncbi:MAG: hypothetical protein ACQGTM_06135 [bacterium]